MSLESLVREVQRRCVEFDTNVWEIADRHRWEYEDAFDFIGGYREPTQKMLRDLAREFHIRAECLRETLDE